MAQINISKTDNPNIPPTGREGIFIDTDGILKAIDDAGNQRVIQEYKAIQFYPTEQIDDFTITADMLYKLVEINSATDVEVTVDNMGVGDWIEILVKGAGLPIFLEGVNQSISEKDLTDRTNIVFRRLEDDGTTEQYEII